MRHFRGFDGPPRCATFVALHMSHCELCKCKWESFMTNQNICCDSALASSVLADSESYFWIDFLQGDSIAESGSIISHYFRTYFSLYVVPRGLSVGVVIAIPFVDGVEWNWLKRGKWLFFYWLHPKPHTKNKQKSKTFIVGTQSDVLGIVLVQTWYDDSYYQTVHFNTGLTDRNFVSRSQECKKV